MISITGASCCLPGGIETVDEFWQALVDGKNMISEVPEDRWSSKRFYHENPEASGKTYMKYGHFVNRDLSQFDYDALRISKREAEGLDPQQRLLLELTWQAMDSAGLAIDNLPNRKVGVYVGGFTLDHFLGQFSSENRHAIGVHTASGSTLTMLSNRISHTFDFQGPSLTIDTACSSSLVAFHYACEDLKKGLCEFAVVGGVNLMVRPEYPIGMAKGGFLAKDGRSKSFDARGDGYGRGEGGVVLVLRRSEDAELDNDNIIAECVATGVNQDGRTPGITLPSPKAQVELMDEVLTRNNIDPNHINYVEAHGTGTAAGDPIEASSISKIYGRREEENICYIGSAKSNVGHLEAGSGLVGVLKAALVAKNLVIPPIADFDLPNPKIELDGSRMGLADKLRPLNCSIEKPMVAINSFGYGGTNAHAVLQHREVIPPGKLKQRNNGAEIDGDLILLVTAATRNSLVERVNQARLLVQEHQDNLQVVLETFISHCTLGRERVCFIAKDKIDLLGQINDFIDDKGEQAVSCKSNSKKVAFVYTGMGPQWHGMGKQLWKNNKIFRQEALAFDVVFKKVAGFSILDEILKEEHDSRITQTEYAQPANFLIQVALTACLRNSGIEPDAVTGHSVGEVSSAYFSGALSLEDAILVSVNRSQLQGTLRGLGGMLAAAVDEDTALALIKEHGPEVSIAAVNSPTSVTFAGDEAQLKIKKKMLTENEIFNRTLQVEVPYHSNTMEKIRDAVINRLENITQEETHTPCYSTVTGKLIYDGFDAEYWYKNVRQTVRFKDAIQSMIDDGYRYFVEVGPHPVLLRSLAEIFGSQENNDCESIHTLKRGDNEMDSMKNAVINVFTQTNSFVRRRIPASQRVSLPNYPWDKKTVWNETWQTQQDRCGGLVAPMLEKECSEPGVYMTDLSLMHLDFLKSHIVDGVPVIPAAAILEAALEAGRIRFPMAQNLRISSTKLLRTLSLENKGEEYLLRYDDKTNKVDVHGSLERKSNSFKTHMASMKLQASNSKLIDLKDLDCAVERNIPALYSMFNDVGLHSDTLFQTVTKLHSNPQEDLLMAEVTVDESLDCEGFVLHPTLIDGIFQSTAAFISDTTSAFIPVAVDELLFKNTKRSPRKVRVYGSLNKRTENLVGADLSVRCIDSNELLLSIKNLVVKRIKDLSDEQLMPRGNYQTTWEPAEAVKLQSAAQSRILMLTTNPGDKVQSATNTLLTQDGANITQWELFPSGDNRSWQYSDCVLKLDNKAEIASKLGGETFDNIVIWADFPEINPTAAPEVICSMVEGLRNGVVQIRGKKPKITVITNDGIQVTSSDRLSAQSGAVIGATRVVWSEVDQLDIHVLDINGADGIDASIIVAEILNAIDYDEVTYRSGSRLRALVRNLPTTIDDKKIALEPEQAYRWIKAGQAWCKEALNSKVDGDLTLELSAYGDKTQFARNNSESKSLVIGYRGSKVSKSAHSVVSIIPVTASSYASTAGQSIELAEYHSADNLMNAALNAWAETLIERHWIDQNSTVVCYNDPLGRAVANVAKRLQATVHKVSKFERWAQVAKLESGSVNLLVVPVSRWQSQFDFRVLAANGKIVNLDNTVIDHELPGTASAIDELSICFETFKAHFSAQIENIRALKPKLDATEIGVHFSISENDIQSGNILDWRVPEAGSSAFSCSNYDWDKENWMLVSGGFGGIGEKYINWLVDQGLDKILIVGRSTEQKIAQHPAWLKLKHKGVSVRYLSADITQTDSTSKLVRFQARHGKITSIAHLAGIIDDSQLSEMSSEAFNNVIRVKATGLNNIRAAVPISQLDTLISFSSIALITGNSRQSNYCAANQYIENLSRDLSRFGVRSLVVHTGAISDVGMIQRDKRLRQHIDNTGLSLISTNNLFVGIKHALIRGDTVVTAAGEPNWEKWSNLEVLAARAPRFEEVLADLGSNSADIYENLRRDLASADENAQQTILGELIRDCFAPILRLESGEISMDSEFHYLGLDSLMAAEVQSSLKNQLGLDVSILTLISESMSVSKLAEMEHLKMNIGA